MKFAAISSKRYRIFSLPARFPQFAHGRWTYLQNAYPLALALAVISGLRPSLVLPVSIYIGSSRFLVQDMPVLDIEYMIEMTVYFPVFAVLSVWK